MRDDSGTYLRSEVMAATGATRGQIAGLLDYCTSQQGHSPGALHRWPRDEIVLASVALKLTRLGVLLSTVKVAVDTIRNIRNIHKAGELGVVMLAFDATGRFASVARLDGVALLGDLTKSSEMSSGFRLLINVAAEASTIDARLRQHRADHGVARRGPKACRKAA
jgi:hypothetical protein